MKAHVVYTQDMHTQSMLQDWGYELVDDYHDADLLVFTGGGDIPPELYGEENSYCFGVDEDRTEYESKVYHYSLFTNKRMIGICRGAQLLNVLNNGSMFQHVQNHTSNHLISTNGGKEFRVTSSHHQMMIPGSKGKLLAWSSEKRSGSYLGNSMKDDIEKETEIVYYPSSRSLCIQPHPEWMSKDSSFVKYCRDLTDNLMMGDAL